MVDRKQWELETRVEQFCCQIYHAPAVPAMSSHQGGKSQKNATRCLSLDTKQHLAILPAKHKSHGGDNHQEEGVAVPWRQSPPLAVPSKSAKVSCAWRSRVAEWVQRGRSRSRFSSTSFSATRHLPLSTHATLFPSSFIPDLCLTVVG